MDEDQYRATYHRINEQRCVYEKAINNRRCDCQYKKPFLLATREGIGCESKAGLNDCDEFLNTLRDGSRFALRETCISGPLPHNKELKVQAGGCIALQQLLHPRQDDEPNNTPDIYKLINTGLSRYGSIDALPYNELVKGVLNYESRRKRRGGK
uniref:Uncharacterized protein n=1 Tax=uncultured Thiotrichaceae bacterium TaxID=298394 RepID=A0A6S6UI20_9GAMM|nr:MAG: Unknown protein [uncultured Thiotrichaceae bacterium]